VDNKPAPPPLSSPSPQLAPQLSPRLPLVLALAGPTASGKTAAALQLARSVPLEIISVDSALVYRGMDIGTAKPNAAELAAVPHHLIDIIEPHQSYSVAQFRSDCLRLIDEIIRRGKLPLLVGGTMLYFKALIDGLDDLPATPPELRQQLEQQLTEHGLPALYARLQLADPVTAARLKPNDVQRITRALEVIELTGRPFSSLLAQRAPTQLPFALHLFSLEPGERSGLHQRIATRFDAMLQNDQLIDEVRRLRASNALLHTHLPSMRCVGYRQAWEYLDGLIDRAALRETGIIATRQLAKRQLTWLRAMPQRQVIDCLAPDASDQIMQQAHAILAQHQNRMNEG
jgi:tRNA dimethylallyltransferase